MNQPTQPQVITIDGQNYDLNNIPPEGQGILQLMQLAQAKVQEAQIELQMRNLAFNALGDQLNTVLEDVDPIAPPQVSTPKRTTKRKAPARKRKPAAK